MCIAKTQTNNSITELNNKRIKSMALAVRENGLKQGGLTLPSSERKSTAGGDGSGRL